MESDYFVATNCQRSCVLEKWNVFRHLRRTAASTEALKTTITWRTENLETQCDKICYLWVHALDFFSHWETKRALSDESQMELCILFSRNIKFSSIGNRFVHLASLVIRYTCLLLLFIRLFNLSCVFNRLSQLESFKFVTNMVPAKQLPANGYIYIAAHFGSSGYIVI